MLEDVITMKQNRGGRPWISW